MEAIEFCRWLQGYFEIREASGKDKELLTQAQVNMIEDHLRLVFTKITSPNQSSTNLLPLSEILEEVNKKSYHDGVSTPFNNNQIYC